MHGILAAFNEYRSNSDVADIRYKMGQMTKNGGTLGQAKFGYLNVREKIDGYEIRTVATDPERAQYVRLAFELAATGNYTMQRLADVLTERVLWLRPRNRRPAGPISANYLSRVLRDRYYMGFVNYKGEEYQGRHEPLVSAELFARVQAVLDERLPSPGERQRRHHHYLKGSLWCGRCHDKGVESRLLLTKEKAVAASTGTSSALLAKIMPVTRHTFASRRRKLVFCVFYARVRLPDGFATRVRGAG